MSETNYCSSLLFRVHFSDITNENSVIVNDDCQWKLTNGKIKKDKVLKFLK